MCVRKCEYNLMDRYNESNGLQKGSVYYYLHTKMFITRYPYTVVNTRYILRTNTVIFVII